MKDFLTICVGVIVIILFLLNFGAFFFGMIGNSTSIHREKTDCETRYNIDYIAPSRMLGCWLTKRQE